MRQKMETYKQTNDRQIEKDTWTGVKDRHELVIEESLRMNENEK